MLERIDHIVLAAHSLPAALAAYAALFGVEPSWRAAPAEGAATAVFAFPNAALEILAPDPGAEPGELGARLTQSLAVEGEGLKSLVFAAADLDQAARRWAAVGLDPSPAQAGESRDQASGVLRRWRRIRAGGIASPRIFALGDASPWPFCAGEPPGVVVGLDHLVIRTPAPERALGLYGAKLGLDLRMDRTFPEFGGTRLMFFRIGDAILEIAHDPKDAGDGPDYLWGCTWRVDEIAAAHARLASAGLELSPVRPGRKPGTEVFTVRSGTLGVPTLMLAKSSR